MALSTLKKAAALVALVGAVSGASANTYTFGTLNTTMTSPDMYVVDDFTDSFTFTTGSQSGSLSSVIGIVGGLEGLSGTVAYGIGNTVLGSYSVLASSGSFAYSGTWSGLTAGTTYWLTFSGTVTGTESASYAVTLAPVPEPEAYAMLLAGLGVIGAAVRRRKLADSKTYGA